MNDSNSDPLDIVDIWVNLIDQRAVSAFLGVEANADIPNYLGGDTSGVGEDELIERMDRLGVATGVLTPGMTKGGGVDEALAAADRHPGRFLVAGTVVDTHRPTRNVRTIHRLFEHVRFSMVRICPLFTQVPINDAKHYPIYAACEELGIPVGINVGVPGPKVRSRVQHPELLEDVLIDFPALTIIGAHMGHPYEEFLMNLMRKWDTLYLSCSAYAPKYLDPGLVRFMNTSAHRGRVLWASDDPWFAMARSLDEARQVPLDPDAMARFLGGTARRLLDRTIR